MMKRWAGMVLLLGLVVMGCSKGEEAPAKEAEQEKRVNRSVALLKEIKVSDDQLPDGLVEKGIEYVARFAALGEEEAAAWEKRARFPESIMPHQGGNQGFKEAYRSLLEECAKEVTCKKVTASLGLGGFTIMGSNISLNRMFSRKIPVPEGAEGIEIFRLNNKGADTVVIVKKFRGTAYERRGKVYLMFSLN